MSGSKIFITRDSDGLEGARRLLEASGAAGLFRPGMRVALKPNLVVARPASSGATTSPRVIAGLIEFLRDLSVTDMRALHGMKQDLQNKILILLYKYDILEYIYKL